MGLPMKKSKEPKAKINPFDLYLHAYQIMDADRLLRTIDPANPLQQRSAAIGSMILSAFSCELYLKCFIHLDKREPTNTHRLDVLFRQLGHKHKREIVRAWDEDDHNGRPMIERFAKQSGGKTIPVDLPNALVIQADAFERMRYGYEGHEIVYYLGGLPFVLLKILLKLRPDWATVSFSLATPTKDHSH
jgi:hypothetical protein